MVKPALLIATLVFLLGGVGFRSYATSRGVPLLAADAVVFLPPALSFHERGELVNRIWTGSDVLDQSGTGRMVYHGFLYPMFLSFLIWGSDYLAVTRGLAILHGVATLLVGVLLWNFARVWNWKLTAPRIFLILLLTIACANYTQGALGRAEPMAAVVLMLALCGASRTNSAWHALILGAVIGLVTAIDPIIGLFAGLAAAASFAWRYRAVRASREIGVAAACSLCVFVLCFSWYPYSFADWVTGSWRLGKSAFVEPAAAFGWQDFPKTWFFSGSRWMLGATLPLTIWCGLHILRQRRDKEKEPAAPLLFYVLLSLGGVALVTSTLYAPWASYNLLPLMPLAFLAVFYELGRERESPRSKFRAVAAAILIAASLGFVGDLYERAHILSAGMSLPEARKRLADFRAQHPQSLIALDKHLFTFTEDLSNIVWTKPARLPMRGDFWINAQGFTRDQTPPSFIGFRVVKNYYNPRRLSLFGIPLWRMDRGCGFAIYARADSALP
ncbi:MAG: hypothetical protein M3R10_06435 [Verrucomicrobiota bacterium]|nr:hypothetical protein [Verrucomicrobiota bacterium]